MGFDEPPLDIVGTKHRFASSSKGHRYRHFTGAIGAFNPQEKQSPGSLFAFPAVKAELVGNSL